VAAGHDILSNYAFSMDGRQGEKCAAGHILYIK